MIVAKFWDAYTPPETLALKVAMAGVWFGGVKPPAFVCWENNGPGGIFGRKLIGMGYPSFYRQKPDSSIRTKRLPRWGWNNTPARKETLLGMYRDALSRDDIINPCEEALEEAADYIYDEGTGVVMPARLREETSGGRALHGDHVIADALAWEAKTSLPRHLDIPARAGPGTYAYRKEALKRKKDNDPAWR